MISKRAFRLAAIPALFVVSLFAGCATSKTGDRGDVSLERSGFWQPHLLYRQASPHPRLYVEIDAVDGCEPSDAAVEKFREFLSTYCKKPGGIEIVRSDVIPRPVAQGLPRYGLAHRYLNGPPDKAGGASPAFIYVLFYDGALCDETAAPGAGGSGAPKREAERNLNPYWEGLPYPAVILINDRYMPSAMKEDALVHEAGHLLGLVRRRENTSTMHCPDTACRMADRFRLHKVYLDRVRGAFGDDAGKHYQQLCRNCMAELEASSAAAPPTNVRFVGPVSVRSEAGYHVLSLPRRVRVIVGDLSEQDCRDFAAEARREPPATNDTCSDGEIKPELIADEAKALKIIQRAKKDPYDIVRRTAAQFEEN